jgi:hypothetical protein
LLEVFQASPARPSDKKSIKVRTSQRLEAVASDRCRGIFIFLINGALRDWRSNLVTFTVERFKFDEFQSGGLHEKYALATWNLGTISAFA